MKDRKPKYPGRVELTPVPGQTNIYDMRRADQPEEEGDALSKANLLPDETAERLGLDPEKNPQVKDAFDQMISNFEDRYKVGDIRDSIRPTLGDKWALCNGENVYRDSENTNAELYELLFNGVKTITLTNGYEDPVATIYTTAIYSQMANGMWCISNYGNNGTAAVLDPLTGFFKVVGGSDGMSDYLYGYIIGIVWNGSEYVMCSVSDTSPYGNLWFFKSADLETWTKTKTYTPEEEAGWDRTYGEMRFLWDGAAYRASYQYAGYQAQRLSTFDANFNHLGTSVCTDYGINVADGFFCVGTLSYIELYEPGSTTRLTTVSCSDYTCTLAKYAENKYVMVPYNQNFQTWIAFYDSETNKVNTYTITTLFSYVYPDGGTKSMYPYYCTGVWFDEKTNELCFALNDSDSTNKCVARISPDADKSVKANYRITSETFVGAGQFLAYGKSWTYADGKTILGPHPRMLPAISRDGCHTFIKIEEGE